MTTCPRCGRENAADARFCSNCGASLVTRVSVQERRIVTAMFADLARSTGMGEALDPEVMREIVGRFFELCSREVAARGGTLEKFSGDAVMAVFGIPGAHEDDPERAVRAAVAIREAMAEGVQARIGIESGEVVVGDPFGGATMATGDAMNVAARLEQQAQPGEVVVGANVYQAVRDLVVAEPLGELALRGRAEAVPGWRVVSIAVDVGRRRGVPGLEAPLTGRAEELALMLDAAGRAMAERKAVLFTIFGVPGVGKSRLVRETTSRLAARGWTVVKGRCLPYGNGITYWALAEIVRSLASIDAETALDDAISHLREIAPDAEVADGLALALGFRPADDGANGEFGAPEIAFAFRRLVEHVAGTSALVLVFEDIHWAEPALLDLIEYLATWTRDAPVLILCPSRPELLDIRPTWGSGRMEASRISLEPLTEEESRSLLGALLTVEDLPAALRERVLDRAEGNPLYVEEVVRMLIEEGVVESRNGHWFATHAAASVRVPDSIEALIRARLDTLPTPERVVLQAASVVGRVFQRSAVASIMPPEQLQPSLDRHLEDAILREIITEERAPDEPTFRFRHILIRDVAYNTLPKARRAVLHVQVARWLREWAGTRVEEVVEIEAYHLEQAVKLKLEVGAAVEPAERDAAVAALAASARKAIAREDARATRTFAERALSLDPAGDQQLEVRWLLAESLNRLGDYSRSRKIAVALATDAELAGRRDLLGRALLAQALADWISPESGEVDLATPVIRRAWDLLAEAHDGLQMTVAAEYLGYEGWWKGGLDAAVAEWQKMRQVAREYRLFNREAQAVLNIAGASGLRGEMAERRLLLDEARELAERSGNRLTLARIKSALGRTLAETGGDGSGLLTEAAAVLDELGDAEELAQALTLLGEIEMRRGSLPAALDLFGRASELLHDHVGRRPEAERRIADAYVQMGNAEEAEKHAQLAVDITAHDDWATVASTRSVLGQVRAAQGRPDEAEHLLREALAVLERTDFNKWEEQARLANFLLSRGRSEEGRRWLDLARVELAGYGPDSELLAYVNRQAALAETEGLART